MAKDLGTKHTCFKCDTKFYDLNRPEPVCPSCGTDQREDPAADIAPARSRPAKRNPAKSKAAKGSKKATPPTDVEAPASIDAKAQDNSGKGKGSDSEQNAEKSADNSPTDAKAGDSVDGDDDDGFLD